MNRIENFKKLATHPWYGKLCRKITESDFDFIVEFLEDHADLNRDDLTLKINRLFVDGKKPRFHAEICELLLICR